ncbi:MAG: hypothetical protein WC599_10115 [Bacteroidales bacterium]
MTSWSKLRLTTYCDKKIKTVETRNHSIATEKNGTKLKSHTNKKFKKKEVKKSVFLTTIAIAGLVVATFAQSKDVKSDIKYRRSSLHTIIVESENFPQKETILKAFNNAPFPDKYNNHTIGEKSFDPQKYPLTKEERAGLFKEKSKMGKLTSNAANVKTDTAAKEFPFQIEKYLKQNKVANKLVAKWFNRQADGSFDMNLIGERGSYNASEMEANIAKGSARGTSSLADAGIELIGNTFVVISKFNFVNNEVVAAIARDAAKIAAGQITNPLAQTTALNAADKAYEKAKEGYSVWTTSYLYKLTWNDSTEAIFYNDLWMDKKNLDPKKKEAFDKTDLFKLEFIGDEKAVGLVLFSLKEKRTEEQIVEKATIRTIDAVYAKLQKEYDVFKPKVPLFSGDPITAKIGIKEGLEGGEKFDVLEQTIDEKTGLTKYVSKGTIKVDKDFIWDNRYNAADEPVTTEAIAGADTKPAIDRTTFKGGNNFYSGMLIKQIK